MIHLRRTPVASHAGFAAALAVPVVLFAAPASAQPLSAAALEEVVVTARKQEESLQETPVAVSAFTSEDIERLAARSLDDLARFAPGLSFSKAFGRATERPVVRGLSNVLAGVRFGVEAGAAYFVDGIYYPGALQGINMADVERVEIVKGAQSALFGRNSYSGAINFVTKDIADEPTGAAGLGFGSDGRQQLDLSWSQPLGESLGLRASAHADAYDGEWTNLVTGQTIGDEETQNLSVTFDWAIGEDADMRWRADVQRIEDGTRPFFLQPSSDNNCYPVHDSSPIRFGYYCGAIAPRPVALNDGPYPGTVDELIQLTADLGYSSAIPSTPALNTLSGVPFSGVERDVTLLSWRTRAALSDAVDLTVNVGYRAEEELTGSDSDHSPIHTYFGPAPTSTNTIGGTAGSSIAFTELKDATDLSFELMLASSPERPLRWRAGLYHYSQEQDVVELRFGEGGAGYVKDTSIDQADLRNTALFGSVSYDLNARWTLDAELRYSEEEKDLVDNPAPVILEGRWYSLSPRLTLSWRLDEATMLYGTFAQGAKPGGLNGAAGAGVGLPTYEQEESTGFEFGAKKSWADGRLLSNVAVYLNEISELQGTEPIQQATGALTSVATNKGEGEVLGLELDVSWQPLESLRLGLSYALAATEFTEGCDDTQWRITSGGGVFLPNYPDGLPSDLGDGNMVQFPPPFPTAAPLMLSGQAAVARNNPNGQGDCSIVGNEFAFAPKTQWSALADYEAPVGFLGEGGRFFASLRASHDSKRYAQVHNGAYTDAAMLVGARVGIGAGRWEAALNGDNLTDEDSPVVVTRWVSPRFSSYPRSYFANPRAGRWFNLAISYRF